MSRTPRILMCPPDYFGIEYEINPWMNRQRQVNHEEAVRQWEGLTSALKFAGAKLELLEPVKGLPDLVFTANAALIYKKIAVLSRFRHEQRQGEEPINETWLSENEFSVLQMPSDRYFEGAGDALFVGDTLFAGYSKRSDALSEQQLGELLGCRVIPLELTDDYFYHLDTCFCPISSDTAIYYPPAFDEYARKVLPQLVPNLIPLVREEAQSFAANAVVVGKTVVTNIGCARLHTELRLQGYEPVETPLDEFVKAGGSAKCLTLRLDGEEAATWANS